MLPLSETAARSHLRALLQESAGRDPGLEVERPVGGDGAVLEQVVADLKRAPDRSREDRVREDGHLKREAEDVGKEHGQVPARSGP